MCLAVPGKVLEVIGTDPLFREARVSFGGLVRQVNLAYVPDTAPGDFVLVHVGFAIAKIDEGEAGRVFALLDELEDEEASAPNRESLKVDDAVS